MLKRTIDITFVVLLLLLLAVPLAYHMQFASDDPRTTLGEFAPRTHLVTETHPIDAARHPVFVTFARLDEGLSPDALRRVMQECNVSGVVGVSTDGAWGERLERQLERFAGAGEVLTAANVELGGIDRADFAERSLRQLEAAVESGARALMVSRRLGLGLRDAEGELVRIDDERLDPLWRRCGELGLPVILQSADRSAYWLPVDAHNERYRELQARPMTAGAAWCKFGPMLQTIAGPVAKLRLLRNPARLYYYPWDWSGDFYPTKEGLIRQRDAVLARHPNTTFIGVGLAGYPEDLAFVEQELERFDNLYVDLTDAYAELGRQPFAAREFLIRQQDRVLFGMDGTPRATAYRAAFRLLETWDEYFDAPVVEGRPPAPWKVYGLGLPESVLRKIYAANADRVFLGTS